MPVFGGPIGGMGAASGGVGGLLGKLSGVLGAVNPVVGGVMAAAQLAGQLASLFQTSPEGKAKITATASQQNLEKAGTTIQNAVTAGTMDPGTALKAMDQLIALAAAQSGNPGIPGTPGYNPNAGGADTAYLNLVQMRQHVADALNWKANTNLPTNPDTGAADKGGALVGVSQNPSVQKDWVKTQLLNKLAGFQSGSAGIAGSPLESLTQKYDVMSAVPKAQQTIQGIVPNYKVPDALEELRKKLEGGYRG